jgi:hypothetical protein
VDVQWTTFAEDFEVVGHVLKLQHPSSSTFFFVARCVIRRKALCFARMICLFLHIRICFLWSNQSTKMIVRIEVVLAENWEGQIIKQLHGQSMAKEPMVGKLILLHTAWSDPKLLSSLRWYACSSTSVSVSFVQTNQLEWLGKK